MSASDLYNDEGTLDYSKAVRQLEAAKHISNDTRRGDAYSVVTAAALVDIAVSLNGLLTAAATGGVWLDEPEDDDEREVGPDGAPLGDPERGDDDGGEVVDDFEVGDRVTIGSLLDGRQDGTILSLGVSEGAGWAEVWWDVDDGEDAEVSRVWLKNVTRATAPGAAIDDDEQPDPRDAVDELDADFNPPPSAEVVERPRCGAQHPEISGVTCARKVTVDGPHDGKHRKGNLKW